MTITGPAENADEACPAQASGDVVAQAGAELAAIRGCLKRLRDVPWSRVGAQDLVDLTADVETTLRSGFGVQARLAGQIHARDVAGLTSARSAAHLLHELLGITVGQARGRIAAAEASLPSRTLTGQAVEPAVPQLAEAIDAGQVSEDHTRVITDCLSRIPAAVDPATRALCRETLLDQATQRDPIGLRKVAEQIRLICDPDGKLTSKDPVDRAELHIGPLRRDGLTPVRGVLDPVTVEQLRVAVEALSAPAPIDENTPDPRPAAVRRAQAFSEVLRRYLSMGAGPRDGGARPQVVITIPASDLAEPGAGASAAGGTGDPGIPSPGGSGGPAPSPSPSSSPSPRPGPTGPEPAATAPSCGGRAGGFRSGAGWFDYGGPVSVAVARLLACDGDLIAQRVGATGEVLDQGRAVRLFTAAQRRALVTRDRGCAFPNCDIPPAWCESHHITWWSHGGATDLANGVLLCRRHHTMIHQGEWRIEPAGRYPASAAEPPGTAAGKDDTALDNTALDNTALDNTALGHAGPGNAGPGVAEPGNTGPGNAGPGNTGPGNTGPGNTGPGNAGPDPKPGVPTAADRGRPWFIPPRHSDRRREPRRNTHFHLPQALTAVRRT